MDQFIIFALCKKKKSSFWLLYVVYYYKFIASAFISAKIHSIFLTFSIVAFPAQNKYQCVFCENEK